PFPPLVMDATTGSTAYVAGKRLYRTTNSGNTWTALAEVDPDPTHVVIALAIAPTGATVLYAATACLPELSTTACTGTSLVWRTTNAGQSWTQTTLVQGQVTPVQGLINRLAVDPRQINTVYAAIGGFPAGSSRSAGLIPGDLLQSTNGGAAWTSV